MAQQQKPFVVHFVCRGNLYRSRLAAAYARTLFDDRFHVSSSGIEATLSATRTSAPYAQATAKTHGLDYEIMRPKTQTTNDILNAADVIVFMNKDVYNQARHDFEFDARKAQVWHVADMTPEGFATAEALGTEQALVDAAAHTYAHITRLCNELHPYLTKTAWVDVVDARNMPVGLRLPIAWVADRGLWNRGVHVVARTMDDKYLVGKRTRQIVFAPGMLEVSLGGSIDTGELPLQAARRETREETGLEVPAPAYRPLFVHRHASFHPHYNKHSKQYVYVYLVELPLHSSQLRPQPGEVDELRWVSGKQIKRLVHTHRLKNFGRLSWSYKFYDKTLRLVNQPL
ncbi:MAG TPA: NUDIX domain-containing protein [Candidatus Saccharimonadales bacterium]|nr:NUDIX domain-containing protein [Candidatus Saccharimonadales bacterium]